jgi:membrane dipeptidase
LLPAALKDSIMRIFDAHCDAVMNSYNGPFDFVAGERRGHMDLPRLLGAGHCAQVFAVFAAASYYRGRNITALATDAIATIHRWEAASAGRLRVALTGADITAACDGGHVAAIIGLEGCDPLHAADALPAFHALGVRLIIPAWDDNVFSGSATGSGGGLTPEGVRLVESACDLHMMVDVSHASDISFEEIRQIVRGPFVASHSNCRSLSPASRNLTDAQIRVLADAGGVMGINLAPDFLDAAYLAAWDAIMAPVAHADSATRHQHRMTAGPQLRAIPRPGLDAVVRQVQHAVSVGGEGCAGLGGDLDGISFMPDGISGVQDYPRIVDALLAGGMTQRQVELVCWRNMQRVFEGVLRGGVV